MEQPNRVPLLYGYTVCLIGVVVALATTASLINAAIDRAHPLQAEHFGGMSLTSFEAYKATEQRERALGPRSEAVVADTASAKLRTRYDALVADRVAAMQYRTSKTLFTSGMLLILSVVLFLTHWRWMRRFSASSWPKAA